MVANVESEEKSLATFGLFATWFDFAKHLIKPTKADGNHTKIPSVTLTQSVIAVLWNTARSK